ncbi:MAG: CBS domain-containing protein [Polyangiaceae bacterium]|nr:CBS domain-containing protein [Polyangiaceae bacterium]
MIDSIALAMRSSIIPRPSKAHLSSEIPRPIHVPKAQDIMNRRVTSFSLNDRVSDAIQLMIHDRISEAPVCDDKQNILGMLSELDCIQAITAGAYDGDDYGRKRFVKEVMSSAYHSVAPYASLYTLAGLFSKHNIRRMLVTEGEKMVGIVSRRDVLVHLQELA